ncbi:MAG: hypothetical protein Unbinned5081contig1000_55 [Prokaryotic dsDNA virus sp.]|nr:MAG: hypothetical protein Unbinned5081contig1000_55 [Prokaryotic dsDNA virus sp.]|tara:strand:- start:20140 stop:20469 length:330 start_codon:yes stop_codon:yes gene_type:complete
MAKFILTIDVSRENCDIKGEAVGITDEDNLSPWEAMGLTLLHKSAETCEQFITEMKEFNEKMKSASPEEKAALLADLEARGITAAEADTGKRLTGDKDDDSDDRPSILH